MDRLHSRITNRRPDLSQHFFRSSILVERLVAGMRLKPCDLVVEIGAGDGIITEALAAQRCHVIAVEKDAQLHRCLSARFAGRANVTCVHADFVAFPLPRSPYRVVSNVPFGITAAVVRKLLRARRPPMDAFLVVQREAAEKFVGTPRETLFSLLNKPWFRISIVHVFRRTDFVPSPSVDCALVHFHLREHPLVGRGSQSAYRAFVRATFGRRGPTACRALRTFCSAAQVKRLSRDLGFTPDSRPSGLSFERWMGVFHFYERVRSGREPPGAPSPNHV